MPDLRSGPLAAWTPAWVSGLVSLDQVIDAVTGDDAPHQVSALPGFDDELVSLREVLVAFRRATAAPRVVLPVPGDVRGLPGPAGFRAAALDAGEAVVGAGLGLVPDVTGHLPSSAPTDVVWHVWEIEPVPYDPQPLNDAQYELTTAVRECATALTRAEVGGASGGAAPDLSAARRAGEHVNLPPGFPARAVALLAQAERLQAVLDLAHADPAGGAVDRAGVRARTDALRPLAEAVRRARLAAYNAAALD